MYHGLGDAVPDVLGPATGLTTYSVADYMLVLAALANNGYAPQGSDRLITEAQAWGAQQTALHTKATAVLAKGYRVDAGNVFTAGDAVVNPYSGVIVAHLGDDPATLSALPTAQAPADPESIGLPARNTVTGAQTAWLVSHQSPDGGGISNQYGGMAIRPDGTLDTSGPQSFRSWLTPVHPTEALWFVDANGQAFADLATDAGLQRYAADNPGNVAVASMVLALKDRTPPPIDPGTAIAQAVHPPVVTGEGPGTIIDTFPANPPLQITPQAAMSPTVKYALIAAGILFALTAVRGRRS